MSERIVTRYQRELRNFLTPSMVAIDATAGNGNDTYFLASHCKKVITFDIQELAKKRTLDRCKNFKNIEFHLLSHAKMTSVVSEDVDVILFNLGFLPNSTRTRTTTSTTTSLALDESLKLLSSHGRLIIACYRGHPGGLEETDEVLSWIEKNKRFFPLNIMAILTQLARS